ncbi:unnamed protein product [Adineta steineri]|uniref:Uncharacterized protein n=1 Tax=Adineta steineri TaxID=433720 RepID=A0A815IMN6_9BILA|nr:unnamed protein product [Adineta steineri]
MQTVSNWVHIKSQGEIAISNFFEQQKKLLRVNILKKSDEIDDWHNGIIRLIQEHVAKQKATLQNEYEQQKGRLNAKYRDFMDTLFVYEENHNSKQIEQLIKQCSTLKFELSMFEYPNRNIPFIQLTTTQQSTETKKVEHNTNQAKDDLSQITSRDNRNIDTMHHTGVNKTSLAAATSSVTEKINQLSVIPKSTNIHSQIINSNDNKYFDINDRNDDINMCPTCYMIFPANMTTKERSGHINEHFKES